MHCNSGLEPDGKTASKYKTKHGFRGAQPLSCWAAKARQAIPKVSPLSINPQFHFRDTMHVFSGASDRTIVLWENRVTMSNQILLLPQIFNADMCQKSHDVFRFQTKLVLPQALVNQSSPYSFKWLLPKVSSLLNCLMWHVYWER